jgi:hypothetical protein
MSFIAFALSVAPVALMFLAWTVVCFERRRVRCLHLHHEPPRSSAQLEHAEHVARNRDLAIWNSQFRPSDGEPVFRVRESRPAFREYVHVDPFTEETVVKCGLMKKVVLPS